MEPTNKKRKILLIDDRLKELQRQIIIPLEELGYEVTQCAQPKDGLAAACHGYHLIFIDLVFENSLSFNGASLGLKIRKKCPLVPLVLLTAHGDQQIREFIYVGFDDYVDKNIEGEDEAELTQRLVGCIEKAYENAQKRIPSRFKSQELERARTRLNALQQAYTELQINRSDKNVAVKVYKYEIDHGEIFKSASLSSQALLGYFRLYNKGAINSNALKAVQLISENRNEWDKVQENFVPIQKLIKEFEL